jgi:hypothetical protein
MLMACLFCTRLYCYYNAAVASHSCTFGNPTPLLQAMFWRQISLMLLSPDLRFSPGNRHVIFAA